MKYATESKLTISEVLDRAAEYFGEGGLGLEISSRDECCVSFAGGGGHVTVTVTEGEKTSVDVETREWDYHVRKFMAEKLN
jgi:hypothetical protein